MLSSVLLAAPRVELGLCSGKFEVELRVSRAATPSVSFAMVSLSLARALGRTADEEAACSSKLVEAVDSGLEVTAPEAGCVALVFCEVLMMVELL